MVIREEEEENFEEEKEEEKYDHDIEDPGHQE